MRVLEELIGSCADHPVTAVQVGVFDTLVESAGCGLASTLKAAGCGKTSGGRALEFMGKSVRELAAFALSADLLEASIGMAAINGAVPGAAATEVNGLELILRQGRGKRVALIGHFPFFAGKEEQFSSFMIFEKEPQPGDLPEAAIPERLPEADVVGLTATTLTNHTFHEVMACVRPDAYVVMLGPTTPLSPVLFDHGVDALCGARVTDPVAVRAHVAAAVPFRFIPGVLRATLLKDDGHA